MKESMTEAMKLNQAMCEATCETSGTKFCKRVCSLKANIVAIEYYQGTHTQETIENVAEDYYKAIDQMLRSLWFLPDEGYQELISNLRKEWLDAQDT